MSTLTAPDKRGQPKAVKDPLKKRRPAAGGELRPITRKPASPRTPAGPAPPSLGLAQHLLDLLVERDYIVI